jgi:transcriptional regulator with XRE-family HTH domain/dephospho-CoA kinase
VALLIKNERQYRITRAQAEKFETAVQDLKSAPAGSRVHPKLHQAQIDALQSQLAELREELEEYEALRSGRRRVLQLNSFADLPRALIQARIASGMTQEDLAKKLGIKAQQIQRYEASEYLGASLSRVSEVVRALGLRVREDVFLHGGQFSLTFVLKKLSDVGLREDFVRRRLLPKPTELIAPDIGKKEAEVALEAAEGLHRIYGWSPGVLFGTKPLALQSSASATARFKLPARVRKEGLGAYVIYAHYLALLALQATPNLKARALPKDYKELRNSILQEYGELNFETTLKYIWSVGIPVLALNDAGGFHGACWRIGGRNVIVLKQRTKSASIWLNDLLHEFFHAAQNRDLEEHPVIEENEMSPSRRNSAEEQAASRFAGDVILDGRAEQLAQKCVEKAENKVERLKNAVPIVAQDAQVAVDALANYMAFRLSLQGINWWGAANNLQTDNSAQISTPRDLLLGTANLGLLNPIDRDLLLRALEPLVVGFAGRIGSGKSTLSVEVARVLGWPRASFGDYLRTLARSSGLDESREVLQELGESLIEQGAEEFCRAVLTHYGWSAGEPLIIDGIRHVEVIRALRKLVAPLEVRVIFLDVDEKKRLERLQKFDETISNKLATVESHPTEHQVRETLPEQADLRLPGDRPIPELVATVVNWIHRGDGVPKSAVA